MYAVDAATGTKRWSFATGDEITWSSPAVANGVVYAGSEDKTVYAFDAETGAELWSFTTSSEYFGIHGSSPTVVDGTLYIANEFDFTYFFALP